MPRLRILQSVAVLASIVGLFHISGLINGIPLVAFVIAATGLAALVKRTINSRKPSETTRN